MSTIIADDDTLETGYDAALDTLTDDQFIRYMEDGTLPHGVELQSSSNEAEPEVEEPTSGEAELEDELETKAEDDETNEEEPESNAETTEDETEESEETPEENLELEEDSFKKLFSKPIKANGSEFVLESLEDAISLIQKGAGYEAKMKKIKPSMKIIKSLENNQISEAEVNFLIDVHKGDKTAIKELLKRHNLDTLEIDDVEDTYTPGSNLVTDEAFKLASNIEEIQNSEFSGRIGNVVTDVWDEESKAFIAQRPETLLELLEEFKLGRFDAIQALVARENALGKNKVPDIVRYGELAKMYEEGELKLNIPTKPDTKQVKEEKKSAKPAPKSAKPAAPPKKKTPADYTAKELEKMSDSEYLEKFGDL